FIIEPNNKTGQDGHNYLLLSNPRLFFFFNLLILNLKTKSSITERHRHAWTFSREG
ncbi:unnamed protein product, partial [Brassica oleracea]